MEIDVNGIEVEIDDRHVNNPVMWMLRFVLGPDPEQAEPGCRSRTDASGRRGDAAAADSGD